MIRAYETLLYCTLQIFKLRTHPLLARIRALSNGSASIEIYALALPDAPPVVRAKFGVSIS